MHHMQKLIHQQHVLYVKYLGKEKRQSRDRYISTYLNKLAKIMQQHILCGMPEKVDQELFDVR